MAFGNDEAVYLRASSDFEEMVDADMEPANDASFGSFGDEQGVALGRCQFTHSAGDLARSGGITELAAQVSETRGIGGFSATNFQNWFVLRGHGMNFAAIR